MYNIKESPSLLTRLERLYGRLSEVQKDKARMKQAQTGRPLLDTRREIVNTLEHTYGPILMALGFGFFFSGTDAAEEVIFGFVTALNDGWLSAPAGVPWAQALSAKLISLFLLAAVQIFTYSLAHNTLRLVGEMTPVARRVLIVIPIASIGFVFTGFWEASKSAEWPGLTMNSMIGLGFLAAMMLGHLVYVALPVFMNDTRSREDLILVDIIQRVFVWIALGLLLACMAIGLFMPIYAVAAGPIGVAAGFAIFGAALLSVLTVISTLMPGRFPLVLLLVMLGIAVSSVGAAISMTLLAFALFYVNVDRHHPVATAAFGLLWVLCGLYILGFTVVKDCITLSGCNIVQGAEPAQTRAPELADAIAQFRANTPADTPLRIVAAQGGGLFAAHHTATYLAARADAEPGFAQSVFAISGVSGGSVGAGVYWAVRASGLCARDTDKTADAKDGTEIDPAILADPDTAEARSSCHLAAVRQITERDYLSPALAALLFRDNLDNFLPVSTLTTMLGAGPIDRGYILERTLARAVRQWRQAAGGAATDQDSMLLDTPISDSLAFDRGAPLLFMNGTRVDTGERYVLSPIRSFRPVNETVELFIPDQNAPDLYTRFRLSNGNDVSVANAMVISARFPVVTPPARLVQPEVRGEADRDTIQLVDGGYFDNSGIETALDLVMALRRGGVQREIQIIQLKVNESGLPDEEEDDDPTQPQMKGTFGAPVSGFFGAWRARIDLSERRMFDALRQRDVGAKVRICRVSLEADEFNFTLSWYLARRSFDAIAEQALEYANGQLNGQQTCPLASALQ